MTEIPKVNIGEQPQQPPVLANASEEQVYSFLIGIKKVFTYFIVSGVGLTAFAQFDFVKANSIIDFIIASGGIGVLAGLYNFIKFEYTKMKKRQAKKGPGVAA
jgi:hypothetical protein